MTMAKSSYETYSDWEKRVFCDNASRRGSGVSVKPQCTSGKREFECTVTYNEGGSSDTMVLCSACRQRLKQLARKHGYKFSSKPVPESLTCKIPVRQEGHATNDIECLNTRNSYSYAACENCKGL